MKKWKSIVLVVSLLLNLALLVGFVAYNRHRSNTTEHFLANMAEAENHLLKVILSELESNDPEQITDLKAKLEELIEMGENNVAVLHQAAR